MGILNVHLYVGLIVVLTSLAAIFWVPARRFVLYLLVLQIVLGFAIWGITKLVPPPAHWILAIFSGGVYAMASAFERRGRPRALVLGTLVVGFLVLGYVYGLGQHAVRASHG